MEEDSFPIRLLKSLGKQKLEKELKRLKMEEEASVKISLENRFKEALRKAKEVREDIRDYEGEPSTAECLAYDMQYVEKYVNQLKEENEIYKEELKKIDKALNLEEGTAAPYRSDIIESLKRGIEQLKKIIDNSIPKSKIKEKKKEKEESFKKTCELHDCDTKFEALNKLQYEIDLCEELLEEE